MSEVKLNLTDSQQILTGIVHGSMAETVVAALTAEPETLAELDQALDRFQKRLYDVSHFGGLDQTGRIDEEPWDAGIVIIDLAARIVAADSSYSKPRPQGRVYYHDGSQATDIPITYRLSNDWLFLDSILEYLKLAEDRKAERARHPPEDTRAVLYGQPFLKWLVTIVRDRQHNLSRLVDCYRGQNLDQKIDEAERKLSTYDFEVLRLKISEQVAEIHALWLLSPREDLRNLTPRDVLLEKQDLIEADLDSRSLQWTLLGEGAPCLSKDSWAYRYAGFGLHEWVIYYDLVRHLIWRALNHQVAECSHISSADEAQEISRLERLRDLWLERPESDYDGRVPAVLIENERKRLPIAMSPREMIVDEDCPACQMMADEDVWGGPGFWHLDGSHIDDDFAFSCCRTRKEWEEEQLQRKRFSEQFDREWRAREQRLASEEAIGSLYDHSAD